MHRANSRRPTSPDSTPRIKCTMMVDATRVGVLGPNCARHILLLATLHLLDKAWRKKRVSWCDLYLGLSLPHLSCHDMRCYEWDEMRTRHASKGKKKDKKKRGEPRTSLCRGGAHCTPWLDSSDPKKKMATNPAFEAKSRWLAAAKSERLWSIDKYISVSVSETDRSIDLIPSMIPCVFFQPCGCFRSCICPHWKATDIWITEYILIDAPEGGEVHAGHTGHHPPQQGNETASYVSMVVFFIFTHCLWLTCAVLLLEPFYLPTYTTQAATS